MAMRTRGAREKPSRRRPCAHCRHWRELAERRERENRRLRRRIERLETQLETAQRAGKRQAAPFSKGEPKAHPRRPGRKAGAAYGPRARRPIPAHVDETIDVPLPAACDCGGEVEPEGVADQYQTDIPPVRPRVTCFRVHLGHCLDCGRPVRGHDPRQTSTALGAAASQLGPRAVALAADLNKRLGVPYGKIVSLYQVAFGLAVSRGGLCLALARLARSARPTYQHLIESVRQAPVVAPDETGWKVAGRLSWLWVFVTDRVTVYAILITERLHLFTFLRRNDVQATNWRAEQAIRPAVVTRKVCGGNRSWAGAQTQQVLASVLRTCQQQGRDPLDLFVHLLQSGTAPPLAADTQTLVRPP